MEFLFFLCEPLGMALLQEKAESHVSACQNINLEITNLKILFMN